MIETRDFSSRKLKKFLLEVYKNDNWEEVITSLVNQNASAMISPLIQGLYNTND